MTFDQLVLRIDRGSSVKPLVPAIEANTIFTSRGCCTSAQTLLSLVAHPLFACLSSMNIFFVGRAKLLHSVLSWCASTELFPSANSNIHQQSSSKQQCETLRSSYMSLRSGPSGATVEKILAAVTGHASPRLSTTDGAEPQCF